MSCPACGASTRSRRSLRIRGYTFATCAACRTLYCDDAPASADVADVYASAEYFSNPSFGSADSGGYYGYKNYLSDRAGIQRKFALVLAHVERLRRPGALLDVGAGPGFLVAEAKERGWDATGIDVNPWAAAYARDELGVTVRETDLAAAGFGPEEFDAVTAMDLVEHVPDPDPLLAEIHRITRPGSALAVLTPDAGSWVSRVLGRRWPEVQRVPEHLILYSATGLASLLARRGFRAVGWHSIGKESELRTLVADISPAAPRIGAMLERLVANRRVGRCVVDLDPRTKLCLYAVRGERAPVEPPVKLTRLPKRLT